MKELIGYCGLNCETCEAYIATKNDDNELRKKVSKLWSELNGIEITPEMINCTGCRVDGVKTIFCDSICQIRQCALAKNVETCADCEEMEECEKLKMIFENNQEAQKNLENLKKHKKL
ncbi:MAG: DUF3795 domain-containing protein [Methanobrevibacter sp.]|nr:DUF3795 domain-containing protein [Methanobrevibacter sp.]